ncbi:MAG: DUF488 domain-containing protein [Alphaproteobacteria bacterium]|nr:DUF488 domain-containing protein [Alphaproteobacteria bacterium]
MDAPPVIHTLGHSRHPIEVFVAHLRAQGIAAVADARGQPFSRFNPQFNRERLRAALAAAGIDYVWMGEHLSGRPRDPIYRRPDGSIEWEKVVASTGFQDAIAALAALARSRAVAMICAEEDPRRCHRRFLLAPAMEAAGFRVRHIRGDGRIEREEELRAGEAAPELPLFGRP